MNTAITAVWPGRPYPQGATWDGEGVNFSLLSQQAEKVELCLFDAKGRREIRRIPLLEQTEQVWHSISRKRGRDSCTATGSMVPIAPSAGSVSTRTSCWSTRTP